MTPFPSEPQPRDESAAFLTRRLSPHDLEAAIALFRDSYPERSEEAQQWITGGSASSDLAWVAVTRLDGVVIGSGRCWRVEGDRFRVELVVDRAWRRRGVGTRLLEQLMAAVSREGGATLQARARADWTDSLTFLEHRGFNETMRMESSVLALDHIDPRVLARAVDREEQLEANGIRVATFATEARSDTRCWTRLAELQLPRRLAGAILIRARSRRPRLSRVTMCAIRMSHSASFRRRCSSPWWTTEMAYGTRAAVPRPLQ